MIGQLQVPNWGWWIILYFFFGGIAGGAYFLATIIEVVGNDEDRPVARMGYYIAFPLIIVCTILLIVDLGRPERFWHMVLYSRTYLPWVKWNSPISVGAYALLFFGLFSFLSLVDALVETGRIRWASVRARYSGTPRKVYAVIGALFGLFFTAYTGELLATTHMPMWTSNPLLGALFSASGVSTGITVVSLALTLSKAPLGEGWWAKLQQNDSMVLVLELLLLILFMIVLGAATAPLTTGLGGVLFIGGVFIVGVIIPLALQLWPSIWGALGAPLQRVIVGLMILTGGLLMRATIVLGGQGLL